MCVCLISLYMIYIYIHACMHVCIFNCLYSFICYLSLCVRVALVWTSWHQGEIIFCHLLHASLLMRIIILLYICQGDVSIRFPIRPGGSGCCAPLPFWSGCLGIDRCYGISPVFQSDFYILMGSWNCWLVAWNHGILNRFHRVWKCHTANWLSLHDFSEGLVGTTNQKWCILRLRRVFVGDSDDQPKDLGIGCFPPRFRKQPCRSSGNLLQFVIEHGPLIELIYLLQMVMFHGFWYVYHRVFDGCYGRPTSASSWHRPNDSPQSLCSSHHVFPSH